MRATRKPVSSLPSAKAFVVREAFVSAAEPTNGAGLVNQPEPVLEGTGGSPAGALELSPAELPTTHPVRWSFSAWRMGLVVSASALCGGIAVVLWNRRLLARMREEAPGGPPEGPDLWEDDV